MSYILATNGYVEHGVFTPIPPSPPSGKEKNLFKWSEQYVNATRERFAQIDITYVRGTEEEALCATPAMTTFRYIDRHGISMRSQTRDYLMSVNDLIINSVQVKPEEGDLIYEEEGGVRYIYEVGAYNGEPLWRISGAFREVLRIHAKKIDEVVL